MKAILTAKRLTSILALLLAITMLFSACGGTESTESGEQTESGESNIDDPENPDDPEDPENPDDTPSGETSNPSGPSNAKVEANFNNSNEKNIYKNVPNKKQVHVLMWRDYTKTEQKLIAQYEKLTGVKIKTTKTHDDTYATKLVSLITGGNAPDVVKFESKNFPGMITQSIQPLNEKYFDLDADCWNKAYMNAFAINGKYYGVAMPSAWQCEDCCFVTYYLPSVLKECNVTTMPYQLYTQGKWNWDTQAEIVSKVQKEGKGYTGLSIQRDSIFMLSAGLDFVSYDGKQFTNNLASVQAGGTMVKAWQEMAKLSASNSFTYWDSSLVSSGKVGLFTAIAYGLYNEGGWFDNAKGGYATIQAVPVAGPKGGTAYTPVSPKLWGVARKAKNAEGAAYFLRYFLDVSNYDQSSTFYNKQFETVYKKITDKNAKKCVQYGEGVTDMRKTGNYNSLTKKIVAATPANVKSVIDSNKNTIKTGIDSANKALRAEIAKQK